MSERMTEELLNSLRKVTLTSTQRWPWKIPQYYRLHYNIFLSSLTLMSLFAGNCTLFRTCPPRILLNFGPLPVLIFVMDSEKKTSALVSFEQNHLCLSTWQNEKEWAKDVKQEVNKTSANSIVRTLHWMVIW